MTDPRRFELADLLALRRSEWPYEAANEHDLETADMILARFGRDSSGSCPVCAMNRQIVLNSHDERNWTGPVLVCSETVAGKPCGFQASSVARLSQHTLSAHDREPSREERTPIDRHNGRAA